MAVRTFVAVLLGVVVAAAAESCTFVKGMDVGSPATIIVRSLRLSPDVHRSLVPLFLTLTLSL